MLEKKTHQEKLRGVFKAPSNSYDGVFLQKYGKKLGSCEPINPNLDAFKFGGHTFCGRVDTKFLISHMTSLGHERKRSYG